MKIEERFARKCGHADSNGCIPWTANKLRSGYGLIRRSAPSKETVLAHRLAYELTHGHIPAGMVVMHKCDNPCCVNVEHLRLGSQKDNVDDMVSKGRHAWKAGTPWQKVTTEDRDVVHAFRVLGMTQQVIADLLGVSRTRITQILKEVVPVLA